MIHIPCSLQKFVFCFDPNPSETYQAYGFKNEITNFVTSPPKEILLQQIPHDHIDICVH